MLAVVYIFPTKVIACSSFPGPVVNYTVQDFYNKADAAFTGKVVSIVGDDMYGMGRSYKTKNYFEVTQSWKANLGKSVKVVGIDDGPACQYSYPFVKGQVYTVFAKFIDGEYRVLEGGPGSDDIGVFTVEKTSEYKKYLEDVSRTGLTNQQATKYIFKRSFGIKQNSVDVRELQKFLNHKGFVISPSGAGSPGNETTYFGIATKKALMKFQEKYLQEIGISNATGYFGASTRWFVNNISN